MSETYVALQKACSSGDLETLKSLVLKRPKPPKKDIQDGLFDAIASDHDAVVSFLLEHGAKVDILAMTGALRCRSTAVFQLLLDHGWNINSWVHSRSPTLW